MQTSVLRALPGDLQPCPGVQTLRLGQQHHAVISPLRALVPHLVNGEIRRRAVKIPLNSQAEEDFTFVEQFTKDYNTQFEMILISTL